MQWGMLQISHLLDLADALKTATGLPDSTVSYRVFGDTKKLAALRGGADITTGRFNAAVDWFRKNAPEGEAGDELRRLLRKFEAPDTQADAA